MANNAASQSGLDPTLLKKMLPMLAMLVAGYLAKQRTSAQASAGSGGLGDLLGALGGAMANARTGGDANPLDDILRMAGKRMH